MEVLRDFPAARPPLEYLMEVCRAHHRIEECAYLCVYMAADLIEARIASGLPASLCVLCAGCHVRAAHSPQ